MFVLSLYLTVATFYKTLAVLSLFVLLTVKLLFKNFASKMVKNSEDEN